MKNVSYACDVCKKVKGETNHWFGIRLHRELGSIVILGFRQIPGEEMDEFEHVCGHECLMKRIDAMVVTL